ncbi:hypothetical protein GBA52_008902 [Prunus armeniaca]|nr:hypothetical protein GBA52_008902 [Prunus armeniaca]
MVQPPRLSQPAKMLLKMGRRRNYQSLPCWPTWTRSPKSPRKDLPQMQRQKVLQTVHHTLMVLISLPQMKMCWKWINKNRKYLISKRGQNLSHLDVSITDSVKKACSKGPSCCSCC